MPASVNTPLLVVAAPAKLSEKSQTRLHTHARATGKNTEIGNRHGGGGAVKVNSFTWLRSNRPSCTLQVVSELQIVHDSPDRDDDRDRLYQEDNS